MRPQKTRRLISNVRSIKTSGIIALISVALLHECMTADNEFFCTHLTRQLRPIFQDSLLTIQPAIDKTGDLFRRINVEQWQAARIELAV